MAGYPTASPASAPLLADVPEGYVGNLTTVQADALVAFKEELQAFVKELEAAAERSATDENPAEAEAAEQEANMTDTAQADPTDPIQPGTLSQEAGEANELMTSEPDMLRFLRARDFDVAEAIAMATESCKWRASVKPQGITPEMVPNSLPSGCWRFAGYAKSGMPVIWINVALFKPSDLYGIDEYIRYVTYFCEGGTARMGSNVGRFLVIFSMAGFGVELMKPFATRCTLQLISITQNHYPERLGGALLCEAPWIFQTFWKMISPFINPKTAQKIKFVDSNANDLLLQFVDCENLSIELGGSHPPYPLSTRSVPEETEAFYAELGGRDKLPAGSELSAQVGIADAPGTSETNVSQTLISGSCKGETCGQTVIAAGKDFKLEVLLEEATKSVAWSFSTAGHDIGFGYKVVAEEATPIEKTANPVERVKSSEEGGISGKLDVDSSWSGATMTLMFDNTHSRLRSKTVSYTITVQT